MAKKKYASATYSNKLTRLKHTAEEHHFDKDDRTDKLIKRTVKLMVPASNKLNILHLV